MTGGPPSPDRPSCLRVLGLSLYGPQAASHRVRLSQFQPGLKTSGIQLEIQSLLDDAYLRQRFAGRRASWSGLLAAYHRRLQALQEAEHFDLAFVYAELLPLLPAWLERKLLRIPYILDIDDAFFLKYRTGRLGWLHPLLGGKIDQLMAGAAAVTAGNRHLAEFAHRFNHNVTVLPSVVDTDWFRPASAQNATVAVQPFTVGWIGSPSTAPYLQLLVEPLRQLAKERRVRLLVIGGIAPSIPGVEVIEQPWSLEQEPALIRQFDVGVMPLPDTPWTRGKCAYKLIQCMACGIPVVASAVGANVEVVPYDCGRLARTPQQWLESFSFMAGDVARRYRMGEEGFHWVNKNYSLQTALPALEKVIRHAVFAKD